MAEDLPEPRLLVCLPWNRPKALPSIARKCGCGSVCQVDATNAAALDRGEYKVICQACAFADPAFKAQLEEGIQVLHCGRPITVTFREDA